MNRKSGFKIHNPQIQNSALNSRFLIEKERDVAVKYPNLNNPPTTNQNPTAYHQRTKADHRTSEDYSTTSKTLDKDSLETKGSTIMTSEGCLSGFDETNIFNRIFTPQLKASILGINKLPSINHYYEKDSILYGTLQFLNYFQTRI
ncbi:hypothetical protein PPL_07767 [Heterostelium album PN500]|uniref:Uncharacterized protein n=1 Tax=Heterostelium pallidum (strain ATCC 26659 / Pp 5 / PN500) TaxID=670386 RepID=D3BGW5_HETP5|nr:hypothetical protein PPL_07767 [Heterostelium album PN500]EFA79349.1 hypothetical protein PPL_07767 [Heterostelium album PN500]|eukprot:XP_020431470.1 hypothetical protein PPL_07767 [Heterostelium album PN500]